MYAKPSGAPTALKVLDLRAGSSTWLTRRGFRAMSPDWSPDGTQIVFVKKDPRKPWLDLHVMPAEGGEARNLTFWLEHDEEPAWSPDGREIAFMRVSKLGRRVATYDVASGDVRELTEHTFEAFRPSWSPDGQHIVFYGATVEGINRGRETWNLYTIRQDGTDMRRLTDHEPEWAVYPVWVNADLLPVSRRGKAVTTWGHLRKAAEDDQ
jgi:Tol biopolymer transport system component